MKIKEKVMSKLEIKDGVLIPKRDVPVEEEKSILDQEYVGIDNPGDYRSVRIEDIQTASVAEAEDVAKGNLKHTDVVRIGGKDISVVAAKTITEVLDSLAEGKYQALSFSVNFDKVDSASIETGIRNFRPQDNPLPRGRRGTKIEDGLVVVEPAINGYKITVLMEDISESDYDALTKLMNAIEDSQGYFLEQTIQGLSMKGVPKEELVKNQASIGVVAKARRSYESKMANGSPITSEIRNKSAVLANNLNEELNLMPLTGQVVEYGLQVFTVEVTEGTPDWSSARSNISYFKKGNVSGRIVRIGGCKRKIPILNEMVPEVVSEMTKLAIWTSSLFEEIAIHQLGIEARSSVKDFNVPKNEHTNVCDLFGIDASEVYSMSKSLFDQAKDFMTKNSQEETANKMMTIMQMFGGKKEA